MRTLAGQAVVEAVVVRVAVGAARAAARGRAARVADEDAAARGTEEVLAVPLAVEEDVGSDERKVGPSQLHSPTATLRCAWLIRYYLRVPVASRIMRSGAATDVFAGPHTSPL